MAAFLLLYLLVGSAKARAFGESQRFLIWSMGLTRLLSDLYLASDQDVKTAGAGLSSLHLTSCPDCVDLTVHVEVMRSRYGRQNIVVASS